MNKQLVLAHDETKSFVLKFVERHPGCTVAEMFCGIGFRNNFAIDMPVILERLVDAGSLIEVELTHPTTHQTKSFFYIKGSDLEVLNDGKSILVFGSVGDKEIGGRELLLGTKIRIRKN